MFERRWSPVGFFGFEQQPVIPGLVCALAAFIVFSLVMPPKTETLELAKEA